MSCSQRYGIYDVRIQTRHNYISHEYILQKTCQISALLLMLVAEKVLLLLVISLTDESSTDGNHGSIGWISILFKANSCSIFIWCEDLEKQIMVHCYGHRIWNKYISNEWVIFQQCKWSVIPVSKYLHNNLCKYWAVMQKGESTYLNQSILVTHRGRVTHICVSKRGHHWFK